MMTGIGVQHRSESVFTFGRNRCSGWSGIRTWRVDYNTVRPLVLAAAINSTVVAGENPTVGSTVWLPAESVAPGR
jgi:hypothetical protein